MIKRIEVFLIGAVITVSGGNLILAVNIIS